MTDIKGIREILLPGSTKAEEIFAENKRLTAEIERLRAALDRADEWRKEHLYDEPCGCAYDTPDDWCLGHLPRLRELEAAKAEIERLRRENARMEATASMLAAEKGFKIYKTAEAVEPLMVEKKHE